MSKKVDKHLSKDPIMKKIVKEHKKLNLPKSKTVFHELVKSIVYQQISIKAAATIHQRFIDLIGTDDFLPEDLLHYEPEEFKPAGFSSQKSNYVLNIARYFVEHKIEESDWDKMSDDEIMERLISIKGVGEWTVQMILIFQLDRPDVLPVKDLAIQQTMAKLYKIKSEKSKLLKDMVKVAEPWRPYRSAASLYLWAWKRANSN